MTKCASLAFASVLLASTAAGAATSGMSYSYGETPEQNIAKSNWYDHLLSVSPGFRHYRMHKECGPVNFTAALHADCLASFDAYEPIQYR